jgi:hypothetical protein
VLDTSGKEAVGQRLREHVRKVLLGEVRDQDLPESGMKALER